MKATAASEQVTCTQALVDPETNTAPEGVVLQQFEEHGGVLYKVYVLGSMCEVKLRPSLQLPVEARNIQSIRSGWIVLPRFSTTPIAEDSSVPYAVRHDRAVEENEGPRHNGAPGCSPGGIGAPASSWCLGVEPSFLRSCQHIYMSAHIHAAVHGQRVSGVL